jgi:hypothetical protein
VKGIRDRHHLVALGESIAGLLDDRGVFGHDEDPHSSPSLEIALSR